jgi:hypothetical protein
MKVFPPTNEEQLNGYSQEKLEYLKPFIIYDVEKLIVGKNYALATNGYHVGVYEGNKFISHIHHGFTCGCHGFVYQFVTTDSTGQQVTDSRGAEAISQIGLFEITD